VIETTAAHIKYLHRISRPNNLKSSYLRTINAILKHFDDKLILPVQNTPFSIDTAFDLTKLISGLAIPVESDYLERPVIALVWGITERLL